MSTVCRHLLRATRKRGDGAAMEVLDRRGADTAWHGVRRAVLQGTPQEQGQQRSDSGSGAGSAGPRSLAADLPGSFPRGADVSDLWERETQRTGSAAMGEELSEVAD